MLPVYVPDYYRAFRCIASECRHSCCIGWEIDVDEEALARFDRVTGAMGARLQAGIDRESDPPCFRLDGEERCPFLNRNGLCDLITELGEESLCRICADHPRFRNLLFDRVELGLGLCCEAAARLILGREEPCTIVALPQDEALHERTANASREEEDPVTVAMLKAREALFNVLQDRAYPLSRRIRHVLTALDISLPVSTFGEWAEFLGDLERLDPAWDGYLQGLSALSEPLEQELDGEGSAAYEQLVIYFLYRYLTAEDDGRPALLQVRVAFAILSACLIHGLVRATGNTALDALYEVARMYSSEIEYSEENLERFLDRIEDLMAIGGSL